MNITLVTIGTRGDTQPFVALAVRLMQEGHRVTLATEPDFARLAAAYEIDFVPVGNPVKSLLERSDSAQAIESGKSLKLVSLVLHQKKDLFEPLARQIWQAAPGADAIIYKDLAVAGYSAAEMLGLPCAEVAFSPTTRTRAFPPMVFKGVRDRGPLSNWLLGTLAENILKQFRWQLSRRAINQLRQDLGVRPLPFFGPWTLQRRTGVPVFYPYSPTVLPRPADWPERIHVPGYWFLDPPAGWQPPDDLLAFLQAGPSPVAIGFGSMPHQNPRATLQVILQALERSGQRGILLSGWAGIGKDVPLPESVWCAESLPHSWLFPRMAAIVHHGGAGTTGAALRSGVPSIVTPIASDQPFWARRVQALGVGPAPIPYHTLTAEPLADAIREAVSNTAMHKRAAEIGQRLQEEDGVGRAIEIFSQYVTRFRH
jgi:sterol 3beta-glucosyltransferase